ncbi:MAG: radical SAM protein, partial [Planctomycetota bacterium]
MSLPLRVLSNLIRPRIQHLILHVTDRCNLRCKHCFVDLTQRHTLSVEDAHRVAGTMGNLLWLDIGGGEPFLLKELPELIAPFDCDVLGIPTNGHDPDGIARRVTAILETARAKEIVISVSIEGFREEHNSIRVNPRSFDRAFESLRILRGIADE